MSYEIILDAFYSFLLLLLKIGKMKASCEEFCKFCYDAEHAWYKFILLQHYII
jgi:hypothetical protein